MVPLKNPVSKKDPEMSTSETPCPNTATTQETCAQIPNAVWVPTANGGSCHCCNTNGTTYRDPSDPTSPCKSCPSNSLCGTGDGFCKGSCGSWEWFGFLKCEVEPTTNLNQCQFSISQWKSWLFYGLIVLAIILLIVIIVSVTRSRPKSVVYVSSTQAPSGVTRLQ